MTVKISFQRLDLSALKGLYTNTKVIAVSPFLLGQNVKMYLLCICPGRKNGSPPYAIFQHPENREIEQSNVPLTSHKFASFQNLPFVRESHWWSQLIFGANVLSSDTIVQWVLYFLDCQDNADVISAFSISSNYLLWKTVNCISARLKELLVSKCGSVIIAPISYTLRENGCGNFQMYLCRC